MRKKWCHFEIRGKRRTVRTFFVSRLPAFFRSDFIFIHGMLNLTSFVRENGKRKREKNAIVSTLIKEIKKDVEK